MSDEANMSGADEDGFLVAEYALGLLSPAEHAALEARLRREPALRADLGFWQARLSSLDGEFSETPAPAAVWSKLERRLFGTAASTGFWNSLALWRGLAGAAAAIAIVAVGVNIMTPRGVDPTLFASQLVAAIQANGTDVSFVAVYDPMTASVRLTALSGSAVPEKDFELWAIEGSNAPVSMGVVPVNGKIQVKIPAAALSGFGEGTILAVTLEQKGGSPDGKPKGAIVAKGATTAI